MTAPIIFALVGVILTVFVALGFDSKVFPTAAVIPLALATAVFFVLAGSFLYEHGKKDGLRQATIECKTDKCPYALRENADSTRQWTRRD